MMSKNKAQQVKNLDVPETWIGLPSYRFRKYRSWINRIHPGICGTYCSAVLLHDAVYQKSRRNLNKEILLKGMQGIVDGFMPYKGTYIWDLAFGLRRMLKDIPFWRVRTGIISEKIVPKVLGSDNPVPIVVGTTMFLNRTYKNHWLLVYAFGYNSSGKLYFKAYDNHGKHEAIIPASQTINCVWLEERDEVE